MRGASFLVAVIFVAEIGDMRRFDTPRQLMSFPRSCPRGKLAPTSRLRGLAVPFLCYDAEAVLQLVVEVKEKANNSPPYRCQMDRTIGTMRRDSLCRPALIRRG
jgi:hypothetical protein